MLPNQIDGAKVLFYTDYGDYGYIRYTTGIIFDEIHYFCIAQYHGNGEGYYLFKCNAKFEVISDTLCDDIDMCKRIVSQKGYNVIWHAVEA